MMLAILLYVEELCRYFIDLSAGHINPISLDNGGNMLISLNYLRSHCSNLLNPTILIIPVIYYTEELLKTYTVDALNGTGKEFAVFFAKL